MTIESSILFLFNYCFRTHRKSTCGAPIIKMASMFKKPKRNFRRKVADSDSDQENVDQPDIKIDEFEAMEIGDESSLGETASVESAEKSDKPEKKHKEKKKRDKEKPGATLLSFGDDEEGLSIVFGIGLCM